jgi:ferritin
MVIPTKILKLLNEQIKIEADSSQIYLAMHAWASLEGLEGTAKFMLDQYNEERAHMLKFIEYMLDKNEIVQPSVIDMPDRTYGSLKECFATLFDHEMFVETKIHNLVKECIASNDIATKIFLDWFVLEQIEEEKMAYRIIDKIELAGQDKAAILEVDKFIGCIR